MGKNNIVIDTKDVRTAAVTLVAAASTQSKIKIINCSHIFRGYDSLIKNMRKFGIKIILKSEVQNLFVSFSFFFPFSGKFR